MTPGDPNKTTRDLSKTPGDLSKTTGDLSKTPGDLSETTEDPRQSPGDLSKTPGAVIAALLKFPFFIDIRNCRRYKMTLALTFKGQDDA